MSQLIPLLSFVCGLTAGCVVVWWFLRHKATDAATQARAERNTELALLKQGLESQLQTADALNGKVTSLTEQWNSCNVERQSLEVKCAGLVVELSNERDQLKAANEQVTELGNKVDAMRSQWSDAQTAIATLDTSLELEKKEAAEKLALLSDAKQKLSDAFRALAAEALQTNNQSFLELAKTKLEAHQTEAKGDLEKRQQAIDELVKPVHESLKSVDAKLAEIEISRAKAQGAFKESVSSLISSEEKLRQETAKLVRALRAPVVRGRWGELQLRRVVEMAGMVDHCDFYEQESTETEDGRQRPDLRVRLPGNANVVVDSKVPLAAFLEAMEATDDDTRLSKLKDHARHVATHIEQLGKKAYWEQCQPSPEFVILFLPGEHFYTAALEHQPELIERGVEQRVIIATPMTLISLLRAVAVGWRQERLAENAEEVSKLGRELYDRLSKLAEYFGGLGRNLSQTVEAFNKAVGTLETRVLVSARRFRDLGASVGDDIDTLTQIDKTPRNLQAIEYVVATAVDAKPPEPEQQSPSEQKVFTLEP